MYNVFHKIWICFVVLCFDFGVLYCPAYPHEFFTHVLNVCIIGIWVTVQCQLSDPGG